MLRVLRFVGFALLVMLASLIVVVYLAFGRGKPYPDLSGEPLLSAADLEPVVVSNRPIGNAAVSADGRIFYTIHPESKPVYPKLYEWVAGQGVAFPAGVAQDSLFDSPLGLAVDRQQRLWIIDPASHGFGRARLIAIDLISGRVVHETEFARDVAPRASFLQDIQVDSAGETVYIADVGFWAKRPALIVYDVEARAARRVLERHDSVYPQNYLIRTPIKDMSYAGGLVEMKTGVDGLALSRDDIWLYYAAMNHDGLFRVPTQALRNASLSDEELAATVERVGSKPLNDGLSSDDQGNIFITDVEHQGVTMMRPDGSLQTVVRDERIRWADGLSFGPDGWLYLADSAIPHLALQSAEHIAAQAPYYVWRFRPGTSGPPGQ